MRPISSSFQTRSSDIGTCCAAAALAMRAAMVASSADLENAIPDTPSFLLSWTSMADCAVDLYRFHRNDPQHLRTAQRARKADFFGETRRKAGDLLFT